MKIFYLDEKVENMEGEIFVNTLIVSSGKPEV